MTEVIGVRFREVGTIETYSVTGEQFRRGDHVLWETTRSAEVRRRIPRRAYSRGPRRRMRRVPRSIRAKNGRLFCFAGKRRKNSGST